MRTFAIVSSDTRAAENSRFILHTHLNGGIPHASFVVASDNKNAAVLALGKELGIPAYAAEPGDDGEALRDVLLDAGADIVLLVGYRQKIKQPMLQAFPERILNFHPAPIPHFGGKGLGGIAAQVAVLREGAAYTGPTIHIVDEEYDHGTILAHWPVKVRSDDTADSLDERCNLAGRKLYVEVINDLVYRLDHPDEF